MSILPIVLFLLHCHWIVVCNGFVGIQRRKNPIIYYRFQSSLSSVVVVGMGKGYVKRPKRQYSSGRGRNDKMKNKLSSLLVEQNLLQKYNYIIGCDEAGCGAIAGPIVCASCCIIQPILSTQQQQQQQEMLYQPIPIMDQGDSKVLSPQNRKDVYNEIMEKSHNNDNASYAYTIAICPNDVITKEHTILKVTMDGFRQCIEDFILQYSPILSPTTATTTTNNNKSANDIFYAIVDGNKTPKLTLGPAKHVSCRPWAKGDESVYTVALASVIAKVTRDEYMMTTAHELYPQYGFHMNKGYSTRQHIEAIHKYGPCPLHRASFKALQGR